MITSQGFGVGQRLLDREDQEPVKRDELDDMLLRKANRTAVEELETRVRTLEDQVLKLNATIGLIQANQGTP